MDSLGNFANEFFVSCIDDFIALVVYVMKKLLPLIGLLALVLVALACGAGDGDQTPAPTHASIPTPLAALDKEPIEGICVPSAPVAVTEGESWTLSGPVTVTGNYVGELPQGAARQTITFTVETINDATWTIGGTTQQAESSRARVRVTNIFFDVEGNPIATKEEAPSWATVSVAEVPPFLTLDWKCHQKAWAQVTGSSESGLGERPLASGNRVSLFSKTSSFGSIREGSRGTAEIIYGYDLNSGKLVLMESRSSGDQSWEAFSSEVILLLEEAGDGAVPLDGRGELPAWLASLIDNLEKEPQVSGPRSITRYQYKGQRVYFQVQGCCDQFSNLYDAQGNIIAHPDGGITGQGDGRAPDFFQQRAEEGLVWADTRIYEPELVRTPAPIVEAEVVVLETLPPQFNLVVVSGLPNGCVSVGGYRLFRTGSTITVQVINLKPDDPSRVCTQVYTRVETTIPLGTDFEAGQVYTVNVNGTTITFSGG